jgi:hypothetical protein
MIGDVYWHIEGHVLIVEFSGVITLEDVRESNQRIGEMADSVAEGTGLHVIADARNRTEIHSELRSLKNFRDASALSDDIGWLIVVDPNPDIVLRFVVNTLSQLASQRFRVFTSFEDALDFLYDMVPGLPEQGASEPETPANQSQD